MHGLVGFADVERLRVGDGIYRDGADAEAPGGADDAAGDLAAIGYEQGLDHMRNTPKRGASSTGALSVAARARPSTSRVWAGSITPSSHSRAVA